MRLLRIAVLAATRPAGEAATVATFHVRAPSWVLWTVGIVVVVVMVFVAFVVREIINSNRFF